MYPFHMQARQVRLFSYVALQCLCITSTDKLKVEHLDDGFHHFTLPVSIRVWFLGRKNNVRTRMAE